MTKKIRICHFADHLSGKADGILAHILLLVKYTDKNLFEHYLCFQGDDRIERKFTEAGGKIIALPKLNKKVPFFATYFFIKTLREQNYSIVHAHFLKPYIISSFLRLFFPFRLIYNYNGLFIEGEFYNWYEARIYKMAHWLACKLRLVDIAIAPSVGSKDILLNETKLFPAVEVYYNCAEANSTLHENLPKPLADIVQIHKEKKIVGIIARAVNQKRIDLALLILKNILPKHPDTIFVFCGDGVLFNEMKIMSEKMGLNNAAYFLGFVENIKLYLHMFDFILFTSDYEGFPLTVWEAMADGVPVVSTNVGGIREVIENEKCGLIFEKGNLSEGIEKVSMLLQNHQFRKQLGENGKKAIAAKYNAQLFGNQMTEIYTNLLLNR